MEKRKSNGIVNLGDIVVNKLAPDGERFIVSTLYDDSNDILAIDKNNKTVHFKDAVYMKVDEKFKDTDLFRKKVKLTKELVIDFADFNLKRHLIPMSNEDFKLGEVAILPNTEPCIIIGISKDIRKVITNDGNHIYIKKDILTKYTGEFAEGIKMIIINKIMQNVFKILKQDIDNINTNKILETTNLIEIQRI